MAIHKSGMALTVDTRTATEYGVVRTFGQADFQFQNAGTNNPSTGVVGTFPGGINSSFLSTAGGGYVAVEMVFIQFAGFTFGKSASAYATPWHGYPGNNNSFLLGGHDEHKRVVEWCIDEAKGRVPVIAGAGSNSTKEAVELAEHADKAGASAVLVVTPYYNKPTQEGMYQHFKAINDAIGIPVIIYNIPGRSVIDRKSVV